MLMSVFVQNIIDYSGARAALRAAKRSPITIGTGSHSCMNACVEIETHACVEIETQATLFST